MTTNRRKVAPLHITQARTAERMTDELLTLSIDQARADATGVQVGDRRPQFYGTPLAARAAADHLKILEAEARRRGV